LPEEDLFGVFILDNEARQHCCFSFRSVYFLQHMKD